MVRSKFKWFTVEIRLKSERRPFGTWIKSGKQWTNGVLSVLYLSWYFSSLFIGLWHSRDQKISKGLKSQQEIYIKFIHSEKATKFCEIFPLLLTTVNTVKSKGKILQNSVAFSEYMNSINVAWSLQFLGYLRSLKCQKATSKIEDMNRMTTGCIILNWSKLNGSEG